MFTLRRMAWHSWPESDRERVAVAGDADVREIAIRRVRAGRERRHAAVHAVEAVRLLQEVRRRLRRAADAAHLRGAVRRDVELPERLDERGGDRVVPAAGAERRHRAFVVALRQPERVLRRAKDGEPGGFAIDVIRLLR